MGNLWCHLQHELSIALSSLTIPRDSLHCCTTFLFRDLTSKSWSGLLPLLIQHANPLTAIQRVNRLCLSWVKGICRQGVTPSLTSCLSSMMSLGPMPWAMIFSMSSSSIIMRWSSWCCLRRMGDSLAARPAIEGASTLQKGTCPRGMMTERSFCAAIWHWPFKAIQVTDEICLTFKSMMFTQLCPECKSQYGIGSISCCQKDFLGGLQASTPCLTWFLLPAVHTFRSWANRTVGLENVISSSAVKSVLEAGLWMYKLAALPRLRLGWSGLGPADLGLLLQAPQTPLKLQLLLAPEKRRTWCSLRGARALPNQNYH